MNVWYGHGIDMASEIPSSEKRAAFNTAWKGYDGDMSKAEARRQYNKGWREFKAGTHEVDSMPIWLGILGIGGLIWWLLRDTKPTVVPGTDNFYDRIS